MSNKDNTPKRKKMKRQSSLQAAKQWIIHYLGKHLVRSYQKWFGVDLFCAITELQIWFCRKNI